MLNVLIAVAESYFITMQHLDSSLKSNLIDEACIVHYKSLDASTNNDVKELTAIRLKTLRTKCDEWKKFNLTGTEEESIVKSIELYFSNQV